MVKPPEFYPWIDKRVTKIFKFDHTEKLFFDVITFLRPKLALSKRSHRHMEI